MYNSVCMRNTMDPRREIIVLFKDQRTPNTSFTEIAGLGHILVILITFTCFVTGLMPYGSQKELCFHLILPNTINPFIGPCQSDVIPWRPRHFDCVKYHCAQLSINATFVTQTKLYDVTWTVKFDWLETGKAVLNWFQSFFIIKITQKCFIGGDVKCFDRCQSIFKRQVPWQVPVTSSRCPVCHKPPWKKIFLSQVLVPFYTTSIFEVK